MEQFKCIVLYGSETGTAQDVAERLWKECKIIGLSGPVLPMDEYEVTQLPYESLALFVCSTTGQGDPPTNMKNFWRFLLRKNLPLDSLQNLRFGVLGLGDSGYAKFNHTGKKLNRRLEMLGGHSIITPGWADDQHDLGPDAVVNPWIKQLIESLIILHPQLTVPEVRPPIFSKWLVKVDRCKPEVEKDKYALSWPLSSTALSVRVVSNVRTTPEQHFQEVRVLKFESPDSGFKYKSGDVAVVRPCNSKSSISSLMEALPQMKADDVFFISQRDSDMILPPHLASPITFHQLASFYWDLNAVPRRSALEVLSQLEIEMTPELELEREKLAELSSAEGQEEYFTYCTRPRRTIVELLHDFPHTSKAVQPEFLFDIFQPIRPRMFSIASPPQKDYVELLVAIVKYKTRLFKPRLGLCSNWLASLTIGQHLKMDIKTGSLNFNNMSNLIMVGPGTGVAPFRSYICSSSFNDKTKQTTHLTERASVNSGDIGALSGDSGGSTTLVFGCRNSAADFHFKQDFDNKPNLKLFTAFSRDQPHKIYVQHVISENSDYFSQLICKEGSRIMVAGNSKDMPDAVRLAFKQAIMKRNSFTETDAEKFIESMENKGFYQTETWS